MSQAQGFDGSKIKDFVENDTKFNEYIDKKFESLDPEHKGVLSEEQLAPVMENLGGALGLPPPGSSKESDHIYKEVFGEFGAGASVNKETFSHVVKDVYLGLADGLERDPITVLKMDGNVLRRYAESNKFETDTISLFTRLDSTSQNNIKAILLVDGLKSIPVANGMPPVDAPQVKPLLKEGLVSAEVDVEDSLDADQYGVKLKKVVLSIAENLQKSPLHVAYSEKLYDGSNITGFLKDKEGLSKSLQETWKKLPKDKKGKVSKDYLRVGIDELAPPAGLPPVGAVDEMDDVLKTVFSKIDLDSGGTVNEEEFNKSMVEVMGSLMLQLGGKPILTKSSQIIDEKSF